MALRNFTDSQGQVWRVWNVVPQYASSRDEDAMTPGLQGGWLCFENSGEKRRLSPIPAEWENAAADALEGWLHAASAVTQRAMMS
ncbi:MAG TPA: hypothetical protein VGC13_26480 [Longimicrobium sp.]|jgi:hypothetical protein|uniref:hypothetical protein n=1 Tax=Longimicrobium sp. TaxID=2029185 RepID=UPI002EDB9CF3